MPGQDTATGSSILGASPELHPGSGSFPQGLEPLQLPARGLIGATALPEDSPNLLGPAPPPSISQGLAGGASDPPWPRSSSSCSLSPAGAGSHRGTVPVPLSGLCLCWWLCPKARMLRGVSPVQRCLRVSVSLPCHQGPLSAHSAAVGIGFYGNSETNDGVFQLLYALDHANQTLSGIDSLVGTPGAPAPALGWVKAPGRDVRPSLRGRCAVPAREGDVTAQNGTFVARPGWGGRGGAALKDGSSLGTAGWGGAALLEKELSTDGADGCARLVGAENPGE